MKIPTPPALPPIWAAIQKDPEKMRALTRLLPQLNVAAYDHWDKVRFREAPPPLSPKEFWAATKLMRLGGKQLLPFHDKDGRQFHYVQTASMLRSLHEIDSNTRGTVSVPGTSVTPEIRDAYLQRSLIEEPFSSSVLEGAAATRAAAKKIIEEKRPPKTRDEQMVLNNYRAMEFIRAHLSEPLTVARILEVHRIITEDTLDEPDKSGVLRTPDDNVDVIDPRTEEILHVPPPANQLPDRLEKLCAFANTPSDTGLFLHPILRAIILHFMLAYDHPFWDGNGRCARALFYWAVLRHEYWLLEYVSISAVIRRAPAQYGRAFLYTETDEADMTYFVNHQLEVIEKSVIELQKYLDAKSSDLKKLKQTMGKLARVLNHRQLHTIQEELDRPNAEYNISDYSRLYSVHYLTARADLEELAKRGWLIKGKRGVQSIFTVPKNLRERLG
jgi:Fic family protein